MLKKHFQVVIFSFLISTQIFAAQIVVPMMLVNDAGSNTSIGTITLKDSRCGIIITPNLQQLTPGIHGFHIHEKPDCGDKGMAAAGHLDPSKSQHHMGPYDKEGHLGDLPVLIVNADGAATLPVFAPRLTVSAIKNHSLMIHVGSDNYADSPQKLGGGGERMACGVIK